MKRKGKRRRRWIKCLNMKKGVFGFRIIIGI